MDNALLVVDGGRLMVSWTLRFMRYNNVADGYRVRVSTMGSGCRRRHTTTSFELEAGKTGSSVCMYDL